MGKRPVLEAATPIFFVLAFIEYLVVPQAYRLNDAIASVSAGAFDGLLNLLWGEAFSAPFATLRDVLVANGLAYDLSHSVLGVALLVVLIDLSYYLGHRGAHMISVCWAGHGVHHSSEVTVEARMLGSNDALWKLICGCCES
jgi:sterol desaturase/sphingolipid hydroxylase (fatty acid hydroxylase superfamily)